MCAVTRKSPTLCDRRVHSDFPCLALLQQADVVHMKEMQAIAADPNRSGFMLRSEAMQRFLRYIRELHEQTFLHLQTSVEEETQMHEQKVKTTRLLLCEP